MKRATVVLIALVALALIGGAGYLGFQGTQSPAMPPPSAPRTVPVTRGDVRQTVNAPGQLVTTRQADLALDVGGRLAKVAVSSGDRVQKGDVLARLETSPMEQAVAAAQANFDVKQISLDGLDAGPSAANLAAARVSLAAAQAKLDKLKAGPDPAAVERARFALEMAKNNLWSTQLSRDAVKGRPGTANYVKTQMDITVANAEIAVRQAQTELDRLLAGPSPDEVEATELEAQRAQAALAELTAGPSSVELMQAEAAARAAEIALEQAQADLEETLLRAPFDGVVLEVNAAPGGRIAAGATLITLMDPTALEARVTVIEEDLPLIEIGQPVELFVDALPDASLHGHVARIIPQSVPGESPRYPVYISLDDELPAALAPGMTIDASIIIAERQDVLTLPRALVRARSDGTGQVEMWSHGQVEERTVRVGLRGDLRVEILEGLREGEQVVGK